MSRKGRRTKSPPFVMLPKWLVATPAWRHLDPPCRAVYLELRIRFNGHNNGMIGLGCREAAAAINVSKATANRAFRRLTEVGFIEEATPSNFNTNGRRATEWLLTELPDDRTGHKATKPFASWRPESSNHSLTRGTTSLTRGTQTNVQAKKSTLRLTRGTQKGASVDFVSHQRYTSRSTTSPEQQSGALRGSVSPDPSEAQERRERQHTTSAAPAPAPDLAVRPDGAVQVSQALVASPLFKTTQTLSRAEERSDDPAAARISPELAAMLGGKAPDHG